MLLLKNSFISASNWTVLPDNAGKRSSRSFGESFMGCYAVVIIKDYG